MKLYVSIIFLFFGLKINPLQKTNNIHNFYAKYVKILDICKRFSKNLVNEIGNVPRRGAASNVPTLRVCRIARSSRCKLGKSDDETAPSYGVCTSQSTHYYGYSAGYPITD